MKHSRRHPLRDWFAILAADLALDRRQWAGIAAAAAVAVILGVYLVGFTRGKTLRDSNWGFGPDWDCGNPVLTRDLVCIRKPTPKPE